MTPLVELLNETARLWWLNFSQAAWQSSLLACLLIALVLWGRRWPSPLRYGLVLLALVKFAVPPTLPAPTSIFGWLDRAAAVEVQREVTPVASFPLRSSALTRTAPVVIPAESPRLDWQVWLMLLHGLGMAGFAFRVVRRLSDLRRIAAAARPVDDGPVREIFTELRHELGVRRPARLLVSAQPQSPVAFGLRQPTVIISEEMLDKMSIEEVKVVLAHELAHHRRGDLWLNWLQILLAVVWWFNPVYHWLSRMIRGVREDCCDDLLLAQSLTTNKRYCDALLRTAGVVSSPMIPGDALGFADRLHPLGRRLTRIMDGTLRRSRRLSWAGALLIVLVACLTLPGKALVGERPRAEVAEPPSEEQVLEEPPMAPPPLPERRDEVAPASEPLPRPTDDPPAGDEPVRLAEPSGEQEPPSRDPDPDRGTEAGEETRADPRPDSSPEGESEVVETVPIRLTAESMIAGKVSLSWALESDSSGAPGAWAVVRGGSVIASVPDRQWEDDPPGDGPWSYEVRGKGTDGALYASEVHRVLPPGRLALDVRVDIRGFAFLMWSPLGGEDLPDSSGEWQIFRNGREVARAPGFTWLDRTQGSPSWSYAVVGTIAGRWYRSDAVAADWPRDFAVQEDSAAFQVVVNASNPQVTLERKQLARMFLIGTNKWDHGTKVTAVDQHRKSPVRARFSKAVHQSKVESIRNYWQKMIFAVGETPPPEISSDEEVIAFVRDEPGGVGYVSADAELPAGVKELLVTDWSENFAVRDDSTTFQVIVNASNPQTTLKRKQLSKMFLKKTKWDHGARVNTVDQLQKSPVRASFSEAIHRRSVDGIRNYWEKMLFNGREIPPRELSSDEEVIAFIRTEPGGVGYVCANAALPAGVKELRVVE